VDNSIKKTYRADLPVWILCSGLCGILWLTVWGNWYAGHGLDLPGALFASAVSVFAFAWVFRFRIEITETELTFCGLFQGRRRIKHEDIKKVRLAWKFWRTAGGPLRLIVETKNAAGPKEVSINAKVFSGATIDAVLELGRRVAEADDNGLRQGIIMKWVHGYRRPGKE
jgi:hypothetical protein